MISLSKTNGIEIPTLFSKFPAGEEHVKLPAPELYDTCDNLIIKAKLLNSSCIMQLILLVDAVRRTYKPKKLTLVMHYVPYARQDRVCNTGESLSIAAFANVINSLGFDNVLISNPHSDVTPALLNNCTIINTWETKLAVLIDSNYTPSTSVLVSPDAGALKKVYSFANRTKNQYDVIVANKLRCTKTGKITNTSFSGDVEGKVCIILDDIIDGGYTFIQLAKQLKAAGATQVVLAVTHGIFSKGLTPLEKDIDVIISSDSFATETSFTQETTMTKVLIAL